MSTAETPLDPFADGTRVPPGVLCARCRYDIRGMPNDAACPECGLPAADSLWAVEVRDAELGELRTTDETWRRAMRSGLTLAIVSWALAISGVFYPSRAAPTEALAGTAWLAPPVAVYVLGCWSAWMLATPRTRVRRARALRVALVLALAAMSLMFINREWGRFYFGWMQGYPWPASASVFSATDYVGRLLTITWAIVTAMTFARLVHLAWLSRRRRIGIAIGIVGAGVTMSKAAICSILVTGSDRGNLPSAIIVSVASPTGSLVGIWTAIADNLPDLGSLLRIRSLLDLFMLGMISLIVVAAVGLGLMYMRIRASIARSLALPMLRPPTQLTAPLR